MRGSAFISKRGIVSAKAAVAGVLTACRNNRPVRAPGLQILRYRLLGLVLVLWPLLSVGASSPAVLTNVSQVVALDRLSARQAVRVKAAATITYCDPGWNHAYPVGTLTHYL